MDDRISISLMIRDYGSSLDVPVYSKSTIFVSYNKTIYWDYLKNGFIQLLGIKKKLDENTNRRINRMVDKCEPQLRTSGLYLASSEKRFMVIMTAPVLPQKRIRRVRKQSNPPSPETLVSGLIDFCII